MTFRENIIIFFCSFTDSFYWLWYLWSYRGPPKTDSFTDCGTQEPLWTQNCYFKCCFCACFFTAYYYLWKYPRCRSFLPPKKNNVIPDNDRLSTCYFFSVLQRPVPKFFSVTVPHHRHRCSLHRHRCSTTLFAVIAADSPSSTALEFTDFGKL